MFVYLVLFMRHYTLKRNVVKAEDLEKTGVSVAQGNASGEEQHFEERTNVPSNDNGDADEKRTLEGHEVDIKLLES